MIYAKTIVTGLNRFYRGHFQNARNIKTFFGYASITIQSNLNAGYTLMPQRAGPYKNFIHWAIPCNEISLNHLETRVTKVAVYRQLPYIVICTAIGLNDNFFLINNVMWCLPEPDSKKHTWGVTYPFSWYVKAYSNSPQIRNGHIRNCRIFFREDIFFFINDSIACLFSGFLHMRKMKHFLFKTIFSIAYL